MTLASVENNSANLNNAARFWRGLGLWNFYFIAKLFLFWAGYIDFHVYYNLVFAAALIVPLPPLWLHRLRQLIAIPFGVALLYFDSWLPPVKRLIEQPEVFDFSFDYFLELAARFVNWELIGTGFIAFVLYLFLAQWVRMSVVVCIALLSVSLFQWSGHLKVFFQPIQLALFESQAGQSQSAPPSVNTQEVDQPLEETPPNLSINEVLDNELTLFYEYEQDRSIDFQAAQAGAADFDLLFLNICSLSWDDLEVTEQISHPFFNRFDIVFEKFNAGTSYSGPAIKRLLQANCGQQSHQDLYGDQRQECSLFSALQDLGFDTQAALNHDGEFQDFKQGFIDDVALSEPVVPAHLPITLRGFDQSPIWDDYQTLDYLWEEKLNGPANTRTALLYNSITLHDGNRESTADGGGKSSPFESRVVTLLDQLNRFLDDLEDSGREVLVVLIPEHGAAFKGDRMQISGLRDIPTAKITLVPVGLSFIGAKNKPSNPLRIEQSSSFLALAELLNRIIAANAFKADQLDWQSLITELPETKLVSENEGVVSIWHNSASFVRIDNRNWVEYRP